MSNLKSIVSAVAFGATLTAASLANAALITEWSFTANNTWLYSTNNDANRTTWTSGNGSREFHNDRSRLLNNQDPAGETGNYDIISWGPSSLSGRSFLAADSSYTQSSLLTDGAAARGASFYHNNQDISASYRTLQSTKLVSEITINSVTPSGTTLPLTMQFDIDFTETDNLASYYPRSSCEGYSRWSVGLTQQQRNNVARCPDRFALDTSALSFSEQIDDYIYTFSISFTPGSGILNITQDGDMTEIWTSENTMSTLMSWIKVTSEYVGTPPVEVAEPGTVALLGFGLAGIGFGMRRRRK